MSYTRVTLYDPGRKAVFEAFEEAVEYRGLHYSAKMLERYGFESREEIEEALRRAICVCKSLGIPAKRHFRYFYQVDMARREASREWKVSKLGFYLLLCNGGTGNPYVAAFQMEMLREVLSRLD